MDAVEYIKQARRMCKRYNSLYGCGDCALYGRCAFKLSAELTDELIKESVKIVEQWAVEHPQETRWTKLKKQYPNMDNKAKYSVCARDLGYECEDCADIQCNECWNKPVEEAQE